MNNQETPSELLQRGFAEANPEAVIEDLSLGADPYASSSGGMSVMDALASGGHSEWAYDPSLRSALNEIFQIPPPDSKGLEAFKKAYAALGVQSSNSEVDFLSSPKASPFAVPKPSFAVGKNNDYKLSEERMPSVSQEDIRPVSGFEQQYSLEEDDGVTALRSSFSLVEEPSEEIPNGDSSQAFLSAKNIKQKCLARRQKPLSVPQTPLKNDLT